MSLKIKLGIGLALILASTLGYVLLAGGNPPVKKIKLDIKHGEAVFAKNCAECHSIPPTTDKNTDEIIDLIKKGDEDIGMPGFSHLPKPDIDALALYVSQSRVKNKVKPATNAPIAIGGIKTSVWIDGLDKPWGLVFLDVNTALVGEVDGRLYQIKEGKLAEKPVSGTPKVWAKGQGGLLDIAIDPDYQNNKFIYLAFSHPMADTDKAMTKIIRGRIKNNEWVDEEIIFEAKHEHYVKSRVHFGSRITFDDKGHIYFSIGDRGRKKMAQDLSRPNGKIHRLMRNGDIPKDNPFVGNSEAYPSIWSYGNRNPQGLVWADGKLWQTEHGPKGGDELNLIEKGKNYGWPVISYGRNYSGTELTPYTHMEGMEQPIINWTPSIAVSGLDVYRGDKFKNWQGDLLAGALKYQEVRLVKLKDGKARSQKIILKGQGRVRTVKTGPDGFIYVVLGAPGSIIRLSPKQE